jgi:hypothetical protein
VRGVSADTPWLRREVMGDATLYLGDAADIVASVGAIDDVITDPPYVFSTSGGCIFRRNRTNMERIKEAGLDKGFDFTVLRTAVASGAKSVVVFFHFDQAFDIARFFESAEIAEDVPAFERHALCFWRKTNPMPVANRHYQPELEYYWHGWRKPFGIGGASLRQKKRVWEGAVGDSQYGHPTEKPLDLMRKIVINGSEPGDIVLDPYMGTGTTAVAALDLGRRFVGIEINPVFFDIACARVEQHVRQGSLFGAAA